MMAWKDPKAARVHARQYRKDNATEIRRRDRIRKRKKRQSPSSGEHDMGRYVYQTKERLRDNLREHVAKLIEAGTPLSTKALKRAGLHGNNVRIRRFFQDMIDSGEIKPEQLDEKRVKRNCGHLKPESPPRPRERVRAARRPLPEAIDPDERRVELPPLRNHAPEVPPPKPIEEEKPIAQWLAGKYWTKERLDWYRRHA